MAITYPTDLSPFARLTSLSSEERAESRAANTAALRLWKPAMDKALGEPVDELHLSLILTGVPEIFPNGRYSTEQCTLLASRIANITPAMVAVWRETLHTATGTGTSPAEPLGTSVNASERRRLASDKISAVLQMIRHDSVWTAAVLNPQAFEPVLARFRSTPKAAVQRYATFVGVDPSTALTLLARCDALYDGSLFQAGRLETAFPELLRLRTARGITPVPPPPPPPRR